MSFRTAAAATAAAATLALAGCATSSTMPTASSGAAGSGVGGSGIEGPGSGGSGTGARPAQATITVSPKAGAQDVQPDAGVTVKAHSGTLTDVRVVDAKGRYLDGAFDPAHTTWRAVDPLRVATGYEVRARGRGAAGGPPVLTTTRFHTAKVPVSAHLEVAEVKPADGATVGVAHPLVVGFDRPVRDREAVQAALNVTTDPPVHGAWYWIDDQYLDYRPESFWPAGTHVTLRTALAGVQVGDGILGGADRTVSFDVARRQVLAVDVDRHRLQVVRDGKVVRTFAVSTGKQGWETRNGVKVIMGKDRGKDWTNEEIDAKEEYSYHSAYAMRMTNSGEFIYDAPWNTGNIGEANTSHGCVGLKPAAMAWLFKQTLVGDPVIVRGSPRPYHDLVNRYADWNVPWVKWSAGNV